MCDEDFDFDSEEIPHLSEFHEALFEANQNGEIIAYHEWHQDNYGNFGLS